MNKAIAALTTLVAVVALSSPANAQNREPTTNESFVIVFQGNGPGQLIASGAVTGHGKAIPAGPNDGILTLPDGTISITHVETPIYDTFDPTTCVETFANAGTFNITGGTGRYQAVSGGGTQTDHGFNIQRRTKVGCSDNGACFFAVVQLQGHLNL